jgi:signal transduction histidine kinase
LLENSDQATELYIIFQSTTFSFLLLTQPQSEENQLFTALSFSPELIQAAIWERLNALPPTISAQYLDLLHKLATSRKSENNSQSITHYEKLFLQTSTNRAPAVDHERIAQEMETALYQLTLANSGLAVLNTMMELISRSLDPQEIYQGVLRAVQVVDIEAFIIFPLDNYSSLQIEFAGGISLQQAEIIRQVITYKLAVLADQLLAQIQVFYPEEFSNYPPQLCAAVRATSIRTLVCIPLRSHNAVTSLMVLPSDSHRNFSDEDQRLLSSIGSQMGLAIESAKLYQRSQRLARQMSTLFEVGKIISSHLEIEPLLTAVAENAGLLLEADYAYVAVNFPDEGQEIIAEWSNGAITAKLAREQLFQILSNSTTSILAKKSLTSRVITNSLDIQTLDNEQSSNSVDKEVINDPIIDFHLVLFPIFARDRKTSQKRFLGKFCVARNAQAYQCLHLDELALMSNLTSQVSVALENATLYTQMIAANEKLRRAIQLKDEIVSMVSHDFRSPLTSIQAFSEILQDRTTDETLLKPLAIINRQAKHLASLAADTLTMSRLESGQFPLHFAPFTINELVATLTDIHATEPQINLAFTDLTLTPVEIVGDYQRIQEVLNNLFSNAIKYSPDGVEVQITLRERHPLGVQIAITDKGIGIAPEDIPRLFQKFSRLDRARLRQIPGTGLGLYICRSIIESHGGTIEVDSKLGEGSTFYLNLPYHPKNPLTQIKE